MKKFNLEAAKAGAPIITRDGRDVKFVAHVPDADEAQRVVILIGKSIDCCAENGNYFMTGETRFDLFMKPQKRTVWVNLNKESGKFYIHETEESAKRGAECIAGGVSSHLLAACVPIEIEE